MANFECKVFEVSEVIEHPNADRLNIIKMKGQGFTCISNKLEDGTLRYKVGDWVVYIPEQALIPVWLMKDLGLWNEERMMGVLAGSNGDRVKAIRLRGIYSEGILYPVGYKPFTEMTDNSVSYKHYVEYPDPNRNWDVKVYDFVELGQDVSELLGIKKYEPKIPQSMSGEVFNAGDIFYHYDIEAIQKYPDVLQEGEYVYVSEKCHGTQIRIQLSREPNDNTFKLDNGYYVYIASKGLGDRGLCMKDNENNQNNVYVRAFKLLKDKLENIKLDDETVSMTLFGEVFGNTQDLHYGVKPNEENKVNFFDVYVVMNNGYRGFLSLFNLKGVLNFYNLDMVPILYEGRYDNEVVERYTDGKSVYDENQIREGVVIKPVYERKDDKLGRVILKSVSQAYKLRKNGTEFN